MDKEIKRKRYLTVAYVAMAIFAIHEFVLYYILSTFLSDFFKNSTISLLFALGSFIPLIFANYFGRILNRFSNKRTLIFSAILQFLVTLPLTLYSYLNIYIIAILILIHLILLTNMFTCINIFIKEFADKRDAGAIRGISLTAVNLGAIISPFVSSQLFYLVGYPGLFLISACAILPLIMLTRHFYKDIKEPIYKDANMLESLKIVFRDKDILGVISSAFVLYSFYAVINIYLAIYLTQTLGIPIIVFLEIIIPVSIIPFILIPYRLGRYSDEIFGEKRPMILGLVIIAIVMLAIFLFQIKTTNILVWVCLLTLARTGGAITETENYSYFYKSISKNSAGLISLYQNMANLGPIFITILGLFMIDIFHIHLNFLFFIVGLLCLASLLLIKNIRDKKPKPNFYPHKELIDPNLGNEHLLEEKI